MFKGRQAFLAVAMENKKVALIAEYGSKKFCVFSQKEFKNLNHQHPTKVKNYSAPIKGSPSIPMPRQRTKVKIGPSVIVSACG